MAARSWRRWRKRASLGIEGDRALAERFVTLFPLPEKVRSGLRFSGRAHPPAGTFSLKTEQNSLSANPQRASELEPELR